MGFWRRFAFGLQKWMYGRYGSDTLNIAILITYAVLYIVAQIFWLPLLAWLSMGLLLWSFFREHCSQIQRKPGFLQLFPKACRSVSPKRPEHKGPAASVLFLPEVQKYAAGAQGKGKAGNHLPGMRESVCPKKLKGESKADSKRTEDFHNPPFFYGFAFFKCVTGSKRLPHTPGSRLQWGWGRSLFSGNNRKQRI